MKKKHLVIVGVIILSAIVILGLYQTFALSGDITKDTSGYYNVTVTDGTTVTVPAGSTKTVYYKLTNTNKGIVKYGIGYSGTNITAKYYNDTQDPVTGTVDYGKSKYIKLSVQNSGTTSSTATLSTILGYENGGDLIVPSGVTLVTKMTYGYKGLAKLIAENTFTPNSTVTNNSITYQYDTAHSLMKDVGGNIRYYGAKPNNYIYFNCSDYANQSSSTCETWRIIGVFDGKVKLIRGSQIGTLAWDQDYNDGSSKTTFDNDWSTSTLQKLLNGSYYKGTGSVTYYSNSNASSSTTLDMTSIGIKNDTTRGLISDTTYYLGSWKSFSVYPDQIYEYERGTTVYIGRPTTWQGKIALPYPSDYGYAADLGKCNQTLKNYNNSTCTSNNWMKTIVNNGSNSNGWLLTHDSNTSYNAWFVFSSGYVYNYYNAYSAHVVAPVLSLRSELNIKAGTGSSSAPYQLSI